MAFYPNPNGIPVVPPFGRKGRPVGPQPDQNTGPGGDGSPPDKPSSDPTVAGSPRGPEGEAAPTSTPEPKKEEPVPNQQDEFPTFVSLFANLVGMRTPMAPEAPRDPIPTDNNARSPEAAEENDATAARVRGKPGSAPQGETQR